MLLIIDLNPTNMSCIYSTLIFISEQVRTLNVINLTCVQKCGNCREVSCQNGRTEVEAIGDDDLHECDERNIFESFFFTIFEDRKLDTLSYYYL